MFPITKDEFMQVAIPAAKEAGQLQRERVSGPLQVEFKGEINPVTEVDKLSESLIIKRIESVFPDHDILAEEGSGVRKDSPFKWIIDPLDGTVNFSHGYPCFAPSIALEFEGRIIGGVVYDPMRDELFEGFLGEGSFLNKKRIQVSECKDLKRSLISTGFAYNVKQTLDRDMQFFTRAIMNAQGVRRDGVAAIDVCYVACGRYDGFYEANLWPWDTAAGLIIAQEAGAKVSQYNGEAYTVYEKEIVIANPHLHGEMVKKITGTK